MKHHWKIQVHGDVPGNNAVRYIIFTVENEEGIKREVKVAQYPLEYITNIQGWYSYRSDFGGTTWENYRDPSQKRVSAYNYDSRMILGAIQLRDMEMIIYLLQRWRKKLKPAAIGENLLYHTIIIIGGKLHLVPMKFGMQVMPECIMFRSRQVLGIIL